MKMSEGKQIVARVVNGLSGPGWGNLDDVQRAEAVRTVEAAVAEFVAAERDACAKIAERGHCTHSGCDPQTTGHSNLCPMGIADAIRQRAIGGQK